MAGESIGAGTEFWLHNGSTLIEFANVFNVTVPEASIDDVEVTHYKSTGRYREYISGMRERGEFTVEFNYVPNNATDVLARAALAASDGRAFKIVVPDPLGADEWDITGTAYVKGYSRDIPVDDRMTAMITLRVTGDLTEAASA